MSVRVTALYIIIAILCGYAWKDWFTSLCGLILMMGVFEHEDMPKTMLGIQGLNLWNVLFLVILLAWMMSRRREGLTWDMPRYVSVLLLMYLGVILVGFLRAVFDRSHMEDYPLEHLISEELINTIKWALPGILLFDGCRTRRRVIMSLVSLLGVYFIVSVLVAKHMPPGAAFGDGATLQRSRVRLGKYIGYSACDISAMLAGASWGVLAVLPLVRKKKYWLLLLAASGIVVYGQALTGGRAGYLAWGTVGLLLCLLKWRKYLILAPVVAMLLPIIFPAGAARMFSGFGETDVAGQSTVNDSAITSGRTLVWPHVINKISESPMAGYGRMAMIRTGLSTQFEAESFPHPHNVYLETLLDNGILGTLPIVCFWGILVVYSTILFRSDNSLCSAAGGVALALILAQIVAGIGAQHYYPRVSTMGMWMAAFLVLRVHLEKSRVRTDAEVAEGSWNSRALPQQVAIPPAIAGGIAVR